MALANDKVPSPSQPPTAELVESCLVSDKYPITCRYASSGRVVTFHNTAPGLNLPDPPVKDCVWLPLTAAAADKPGTKPHQDASSLVQLLASPYPYATVAPGKNELLIYRISPKPDPSSDVSALARLNDEIGALYYNLPPLPAAKPYTLEFQVPHAAALGDLATRLGTLNYTTLQAVDVGNNMVRVTSATGAPDCDAWTRFVDELHRVVWSISPDSPVARVFFHAATDASNALSGTNAPGTTPSGSATSSATPAAAASTGSGTSTSSSGGSSTSASATPTASTSGSGGASGSPSGAGSGSGSGTPASIQPSSGSASTSASTTGNGSATVSISQPSGTTTTLNMVSAASGTTSTGLPSFNISPSALSGAPSGSSSANAAAIPSKPSVSEASLGSDELIFTDTTVGDDSLITEKKRLLAALDLPKPEMMINSWILQQSTQDRNASSKLVDIVRSTVDDHNDGVQQAVVMGWEYLRRRMQHPMGYFNLPFYRYVVQRVVFNASGYNEPAPLTAVDVVTRTLRDQDVPRPFGRGVNALNLDEDRAGVLGTCSSDRYCLGYTTFFQPFHPRLTDLLMAVIAAGDPNHEASCAIDHVEFLAASGECDHDPPSIDKKHADRLSARRNCDTRNDASCKIADAVARVHKFYLTDEPSRTLLVQFGKCDLADEYGTLWNMKNYPGAPIFFMECFRREVRDLQQPSDDPDGAQSSLIGLTRAAIADFLYHYKMSQQYPHEFNPYDLTVSAQEMNSSLRPLIDAFNRDLIAYEEVLQQWLNERVSRSESRGENEDLIGVGKSKFNYSALVTVNTISGSEAQIYTTTESYIDMLSSPTAETLLNSVNSALSGGGSSSGASGDGGSTSTTSTATTAGNVTTTTSTTSPVPVPTSPLKVAGILGNLSTNEAQVLTGALAAFQSSHVHIGREVFVDVIPESLSGASSAELQVTLHSDDSSTPPAYANGSPNGATDPEISRFSKSDTTTRVRVDSVKMFEVTSFSAILDKSRSNFPIIPPFVEIPYIGSLLSVPLKHAQEFHSNIAVMSAVIIPTASDLAYGIRFVADRLIEPPPLASKTGCYWPPAVHAVQINGFTYPCKLRPAISLTDFAGQPVREFHRRMIQCLATDMHSADPSLLWANDPSGAAACSALTYDKVAADAN